MQKLISEKLRARAHTAQRIGHVRAHATQQIYGFSLAVVGSGWVRPMPKPNAYKIIMRAYDRMRCRAALPETDCSLFCWFCYGIVGVHGVCVLLLPFSSTFPPLICVRWHLFEDSPSNTPLRAHRRQLLRVRTFCTGHLWPLYRLFGPGRVKGKVKALAMEPIVVRT